MRSLAFEFRRDVLNQACGEINFQSLFYVRDDVRNQVRLRALDQVDQVFWVILEEL